jgi:hypothetical protein
VGSESGSPPPPGVQGQKGGCGPQRPRAPSMALASLRLCEGRGQGRGAVPSHLHRGLHGLRPCPGPTWQLVNPFPGSSGVRWGASGRIGRQAGSTSSSVLGVQSTRLAGQGCVILHVHAHCCASLEGACDADSVRHLRSAHMHTCTFS